MTFISFDANTGSEFDGSLIMLSVDQILRIERMRRSSERRIDSKISKLEGKINQSHIERGNTSWFIPPARKFVGCFDEDLFKLEPDPIPHIIVNAANYYKEKRTIDEMHNFIDLDYSGRNEFISYLTIKSTNAFSFITPSIISAFFTAFINRIYYYLIAASQYHKELKKLYRLIINGTLDRLRNKIGELKRFYINYNKKGSVYKLFELLMLIFVSLWFPVLGKGKVKFSSDKTIILDKFNLVFAGWGNEKCLKKRYLDLKISGHHLMCRKLMEMISLVLNTAERLRGMMSLKLKRISHFDSRKDIGHPRERIFHSRSNVLSLQFVGSYA